MWRLLMRVEKWLMVLSFVPEPTRRNIQHLKDYPVFKVFFFDFRTIAVLWSTRYASAQKRCALRLKKSLRKEPSKARVPRYEPQKARVPWYQECISYYVLLVIQGGVEKKSLHQQPQKKRLLVQIFFQRPLVIPTNFYADEQIRGEPHIENWKMNYDARVWVRPRTTTRVELIRGYTGATSFLRWLSHTTGTVPFVQRVVCSTQSLTCLSFWNFGVFGDFEFFDLTLHNFG